MWFWIEIWVFVGKYAATTAGLVWSKLLVWKDVPIPTAFTSTSRNVHNEGDFRAVAA